MRLIVVLAILLAVLAAPAQGATKPRCDPSGARTVAGSGEVRVYEREDAVVACHFGSGRKLVLGRSAADLADAYGVGTVQVAGRYVAWVERRSDDNKATGDSPDRLHFADARDAREIDFGGVGCPEVTEGSGGSAGLIVQSVAVTDDGALAWGCYGGPEQNSTAEIRKFDRGGPALLAARPRGSADPAANPIADSVAVVRTDGRVATARVYWQTGTGAQAADLRGLGAGTQRVTRAAGHRRCRPEGAVTVAGSGTVRVFERRGSVIACHLRSGRRTRLGDARTGRRDRTGVADVRVAGRYVAAVDRNVPAPAGTGELPADRLHLVDARRGRRTNRRGQAGCGGPSPALDGLQVRGVQVTRRGTVVWGCSGAAGLEIDKLDAGGPAVLDSRPDDDGTDFLEFDSAAIAEFGTRIYWLTGKGARSAELR